VDLEIVEGLHHDEARRRYERADIVVDQLNAGWYGLFANEAMALGKPVVTFLHEEAVARTEAAFGVEGPVGSPGEDDLVPRLRAQGRRRRGRPAGRGVARGAAPDRRREPGVRRARPRRRPDRRPPARDLRTALMLLVTGATGFLGRELLRLAPAARGVSTADF